VDRLSLEDQQSIAEIYDPPQPNRREASRSVAANVTTFDFRNPGMF
jgi:hypothetical protein